MTLISSIQFSPNSMFIFCVLVFPPVALLKRRDGMNYFFIIVSGLNQPFYLHMA